MAKRSPNVLLCIRLADALHVDVRLLALGDEAVPVGVRVDALKDRLAKVEKRLAAVERRR